MPPGPKQTRRLRDKAARLHAEGDLEGAKALYEQVVEADPYEVGYRQRLADVCRRLGKDDEAIEAYEAVAARFAADGLLLRAIAVCKQILEIDPSHTETQHRLADLYSRRRRPPSSVATKAPRTRRKNRTGAALKLEDLVRSRPQLKQQAEPAEALPSIPLFGDLPKNAFISLLGGLKMRRFTAGDSVITEGERGDSFFILSSGRVRIEKGTDAGKLTLAFLHDGAFFGEMALLADGPRTASVVAEVDSLLFELDRELLDRTVAQFPSVARVLRDFYRERLLSTTMAVHPLFSPFSGTERRQLMNMFSSRQFKAGENLITQGEPGEGLYLLLSGKLSVLKSGDRAPVAELGAGDMCGEMSLLSNAPTMASVVAATDALVLRLARRRFLEVADANPEVRELLEAVYRDRLQSNADQFDRRSTLGADSGEFLI